MTGERGDAPTQGWIGSKDVNRALREIVWPTLKPLGFARRTQRTAWRDRPGSIGVISFRSFNSYLAEALATTTFSFGVDLGVFYDAIAERSAVGGQIKDPSRPPEWHCQARKHLGKGIAQPNEPASGGRSQAHAGRTALGDWIDRPDVWSVHPDGSNLSVVVSDARDRILTVGIPWLDRLSDLDEARRHFLSVESTNQAPGIVDEFYGGALGSPNRSLAVESLSTALGHRGDARSSDIPGSR